MSLLGHIAGFAGRNLEQQTHTRQNQKFASKMREDERGWQERMETARADRTEAFEEMKWGWRREHDLDMADRNARGAMGAAQIKAQSDASSNRASRLSSQVDRLENRTDTVLQSLTEMLNNEFEPNQDAVNLVENHIDNIRQDYETVLSTMSESDLYETGLDAKKIALERRLSEMEALRDQVARRDEETRAAAETEAAEAEAARTRAEAARGSRGSRKPRGVLGEGVDYDPAFAPLAEQSETDQNSLLERTKQNRLARQVQNRYTRQLDEFGERGIQALESALENGEVPEHEVEMAREALRSRKTRAQALDRLFSTSL